MSSCALAHVWVQVLANILQNLAAMLAGKHRSEGSLSEDDRRQMLQVCIMRCEFTCLYLHEGSR